MTRHYPSRAFTLIELLVVMTIMVVLLALLAPALDKAVYQAELSTCAARIRAITTGVQSYATAQNRSYPYRGGVRDPGANWYVYQVYHPEWPQYDDRPYLQPFLQINTYLIDPMCQPVDVEKSTSWTYVSYQLWFGWRYIGALGGPGSMRMGQGFTYGGTKYHLLASDIDSLHTPSVTPFTSHPDKDGVLQNLLRLDEGGVVPGIGRVNETRSHWTQANRNRGMIDSNYGYEDGSVIRFPDVVSPITNLGDDRMDLISQLKSGHATFPAQVPR